MAHLQMKETALSTVMLILGSKPGWLKTWLIYLKLAIPGMALLIHLHIIMYITFQDQIHQRQRVARVTIFTELYIIGKHRLRPVLLVGTYPLPTSLMN